MRTLRRVTLAHAVLLENIHPAAADDLRAIGCEVYVHAGAMDRQALAACLASIPGDEPIVLGIRSKTKVFQEHITACPRLSAVGAFCIGTDQIDLAAARSHGLAVFNAPFSSTRSVAELVIGELIMLARQIFPRSQAAHRGEWAKSAAGSHEVRGKVLGIIGYGHIGSQVSVLAEALGLRVIFFDIATKLPLGNASVVSTLDELLEQSDFVSLHVPRSESTRGMIGAAQIAKLKPGAHLLNLSRGDVVDLEALAQALRTKAVGGAAVDVFPLEPDTVGDAFQSPLQGLENVILSPHIGGSTLEAQANIGREVAASLRAYLVEGRTASSVTLPEVELSRPRATSTRLLNIHRNVPGVLSSINSRIANGGANVVAQALATQEEVGVLLLELDAGGESVMELAAEIAALSTSLRTRVLS